jgi:hypothetical protein
MSRLGIMWRAQGDSNSRPLAPENVIPVLAFAVSTV